AFAIELAELDQRTGDWESAAREWAAAVTESPAQLPNAAGDLSEAPEVQRERVTRVLTSGDPPAVTRRLAGELLPGWGQPQRGGVSGGRRGTRRRRPPGRRPRRGR